MYVALRFCMVMVIAPRFPQSIRCTMRLGVWFVIVLVAEVVFVDERLG